VAKDVGVSGGKGLKGGVGLHYARRSKIEMGNGLCARAAAVGEEAMYWLMRMRC